MPPDNIGCWGLIPPNLQSWYILQAIIAGGTGGSVAVTSVIPGTGATNLGKAEDQAAVSGDVGVSALAVRADVPSILTTATGDYANFTTDQKNRTWVASGGAFVPSTFARPNDTNPYLGGDSVATTTDAGTGTAFSWLGTIIPSDGGSCIVSNALLFFDRTTVPAGMAGFTVHFFNTAQTRADNAPYTETYAQTSSYLGYISFPTPTVQGTHLISAANNINLQLTGASGADDIYTTMVTVGAYTPTASTAMRLSLLTINV